MDLDNTEVICTQWVLKDTLTPTKLFSYVYRPSKWIADYKTAKTVNIVGTELQIYNLFCEMLEKHGWQIRDSFYAKLKNEHLDLYNKNNNQATIIHLN